MGWGKGLGGEAVDVMRGRRSADFQAGYHRSQRFTVAGLCRHASGHHRHPKRSFPQGIHALWTAYDPEANRVSIAG